MLYKVYHFMAIAPSCCVKTESNKTETQGYCRKIYTKRKAIYKTPDGYSFQSQTSIESFSEKRFVCREKVVL